MRLFYTDHFELPLPETHQFPMSKYRLLRERISACDEISNDRLCVPEAATDDQLRLVHHADYVRAISDGSVDRDVIRRIGFPWSEKMVERSRRSVGATIAAARACLEDGFGVNLAGGTHHSFADAGAGYCVFNDVAVAVRILQKAKRIRTAAVIDCDAHQGDGTAVLFQSDPSVFTFSIHANKAFPARKQQSDLDIALETGTVDAEYLARLETALSRVSESIRADILFYVAGADPFVGDRLGRLALSKPALAARDRMVFDFAKRQHAPVTIVMAGGYADNVNDIVDIHFQTVLEARHRSLDH